MNQILTAANDLLKNGNFTYAICGGFALDLFTNTDMRVHSDIDVCVFEQDKDVIFQYMKDNKWSVYEFQGNGIVQFISDVSDCQSGRNLMCLKDGCELINFYPCDRGDGYFLHEFIDTGITAFNYLEFLFNTSMGGNFIFDGAAGVYRNMSKAIMRKENVPYLSPELILLYKAGNSDRKWYQQDFEKTVVEMDDEQIAWLYDSLDVLYPGGHPWRNYP